jgi:hypothetical protein
MTGEKKAIGESRKSGFGAENVKKKKKKKKKAKREGRRRGNDGASTSEDRRSRRRGRGPKYRRQNSA